MQSVKIPKIIKWICIPVLSFMLAAGMLMSPFAEETGGETTDPGQQTETQQTENPDPSGENTETEPSTGSNTVVKPVVTTTKPKSTTKTKKSTTKTVKLPDFVMQALNCRPTPNRKLKKYKYLYVGASRVKQIGYSIKDPKTYIEGYPGGDYHWGFDSKYNNGILYGIKLIRSYLAVRPNGIVIIEMGNNDLNDIDRYILLYRELIRRYPKAQFWFVDALPGDGRKYKKEAAKNAKRVTFNKKLHKAFPKQCIGGYSYLIKHKQFKTKDGSHYPPSVRKIIYKYIMKQLKRNIRYSLKKRNKYYVR